jgi:phosphopantothenoylcysteine synthetase/decarboxylase
MGSAEACLRAPSPSALFDIEEFTSTRDLLTRMKRWVHDHPTGVVIHAAAVGDYEAQDTAGKIPSGQSELLLRLKPTPKILPLLKEWSREIRLVSFKAAPPGTLPPDLLGIARAQRDASGSQTVFANIIGCLDRGILVLHHEQEQWFDDRAKALSHLSLSIRTV